MIEPVWIVAFTGHRPGEGAGRSAEALRACREPIRIILRELKEKSAKQGGTIELFTSVAAGADSEAAEVAHELAIPVHVILPLPEAMFKEDFTGSLTSEWPRTKSLIDAAREGRNGGTLRVAPGDHIRPDCYHETNLQLIGSADAVIAVWNGDPARGVGGTGEMVDECRRLDLPYALINPSGNAELVRHGDWEHWPAPDPILTHLNKTTAEPPRQAMASPNDRKGEGPAWQAFAALSNVAKQSGRHFRGRLIWSMRLHFLAAFLAAATVAFSPVLHHRAHDHHGHGFLHALPKMLTTVEFVLVLVAFALMMQAQRRHTHEIWRRSRLAAEVVHGLIMSAGFLDPLRPLVARHETSWRRFALAMSLLAFRSRTPGLTFDQRKAAYLEGRVLQQRDHYFVRQQPAAARRKHALATVGFLAAVTAPLFIGLALVLKIFASDWVESDYVAAGFAAFLPVALPLLAGAATSSMVATDAGRRAERYRSMGEHLDRISRLMPGMKTHGALCQMVAETEEILMDELIEWYAAAKNAGH